MLKSPKAQKILEKELVISRIIRFMAWFFIVIILLDLIYIILDSFSMEDPNFLRNISNDTLTIALISGIGAGFSFSVSSQINENKARKIPLFMELMISMGILGIISVIVIGFYPPIPF